MAVLIENRQDGTAVNLAKTRQKAQAILNALDCPEKELSILIVDDARIAALNQDYLNRSGPTNVIAFPMQEGDFTEVSPGLLGDVVVSVETARREAREAGIGWRARFDQLIVHGILHLCGYDHVRDRVGAEQMEAKSGELMKLIEQL